MENDLIYDVGMNNGDDTSYYLSQGYRVVAIEADPSLVTAARSRFESEITSGKLNIIDYAISDRRETRKFYLSSKKDHNSFDLGFAETAGNVAEAIEVECISIYEILSEYGVPFYMKVDIEGADKYCISGLNANDLPRFVSFERYSIENLLQLKDMGFTKFKMIDQETMRQFHWSPDFFCTLRKLLNTAPFLSQFNGSRIGNYLYGSSGPFGEATDGPWRTWEEVALSWLAFDLGHTGLPEDRDWFDIHCAR